MIAIDTNVLLRRLLQDDPLQARLAERRLADHARILVTDVVLAETLWTLCGKRYGASRDDIVNVVMRLLEDPRIAFESDTAVWSALNDYIDFDRVDFQDALIARKARELGCEQVLSFDRNAQALPGFIAVV